MARKFVAGSSQYLEYGSAILTARPLSFACWFKSDSATAVQTLMSISDTVGGDRLFRMVLVGSVAGDPLYVQRGGSSQAITSTGYTVGRWHHACGVFSTTGIAAYLDGGSKGTSSNATTDSPLSKTNIGRVYASFGAEYMSGLICEAGLWNTDLTDADALQLARGLLPNQVKPPHLVGYWPIRGRGELPEPDLRRNQMMAALNGPAVVVDEPPLLRRPKRRRIWDVPTAAAPGGDLLLRLQTEGLFVGSVL